MPDKDALESPSPSEEGSNIIDEPDEAKPDTGDEDGGNPQNSRHSFLNSRLVVAGAGALLVVAPALLSVPALAAVGFTSTGIQAGSAAAAIHSAIGNVAAGSIFAVAQSAGAGGAGLAAVNGAVQAGGALVAGLSYLVPGRRAQSGMTSP